MKIRQLLFALCAVLFFLASTQAAARASSTTPQAALSQIGSVSFRNCKIADSSGTVSRKLECATLSVPENYAAPTGKHIELFLARMPAKSKTVKRDAVVMVAGGPGGAASDMFLHADHIYEKVNRQRDIYLLDQRGTGRSNALRCEPENELDKFAESDTKEISKLTRECLDALPGDPRYYTTSVAIRDLEEVRKALGLQQWNLIGGSYGARVELHYARRYPGSVRSMVIDSVIHPQLDLGPNIPIESQRALEQFIARCEADKQCQQRFPDLQQGTHKLLQQLKKQPRIVKIENFSTGRQENIKYTLEHLQATIRLLLYNHLYIALLPTLLSEAYAHDNFAPLARNFRQLDTLGKAISLGMHHSVMCTEDHNNKPLTPKDQDSIRKSYMGESGLQSLASICEIWPKGLLDENLKEPLQSDIPTLLFSGSNDPITPPSYADTISKTLSNARHIVVEGHGHGVSSLGCAPTLVATFIEQLTPLALDASCMEKQKPAPFFIDLNGPSP
jgi:pimeloyl-ACP methyl ester carboxylesterase